MKEYNEQAVETLDDAGCIIANKNIIIDNLQARIAELEKENARLKAECDDIKQVQFPRKLEAVAVGWKKQLAASQAYAEQLREALTTCVCAMQDYQAGIGITEMFDKGERLGRKALAQPSDASALDAYVAEKVKDMQADRDDCLTLAKSNFAKLMALTKQRDLAVEAMREALECGEDGDWQSARRILASVIKESDGK